MSAGATQTHRVNVRYAIELTFQAFSSVLAAGDLGRDGTIDKDTSEGQSKMEWVRMTATARWSLSTSRKLEREPWSVKLLGRVKGNLGVVDVCIGSSRNTHACQVHTHGRLSMQPR